MSDSLGGYHGTGTNWREQLRRNNHRTTGVIITFIVIYLIIGLLIDLFINAGRYPQAPLSQIFLALITFQVKPVATLITGIVAVISLWVTYAMHDRLMLLGTEYYEITPQSARNELETQIYHVVEEMRLAAGMRYMPKVYLIEADYMNAFASGYSEKSAMVAITRGLVQKLNRAELQAVMAHEMSHIRHGDIKLTLTAAVLANLTLIILDLLFYRMIYGGSGDDRRDNRNQLFFIVMILRFILPLITGLIILYLSRTREYMADAGCMELTRDNTALAHALLKIQEDHQANQDNYQAAYQANPHENVRREAYIFDPTQAGISGVQSFSDLFSTHPSVEKRLKALGFVRKKT